MVSARIACVLLILTIAHVTLVGGCEQNQTRQGCRIQNGQCLCGIGCYSEYRYTTKEECRKALKGKRSDSCANNPCEHGGACSQTSFEPGYRCRCEGTGFYGSHCQMACPRPGRAAARNEAFPYECIVI